MTITMFSEARLSTTDSETVVSTDPMMQGLAWQRALMGETSVTLAARVQEDGSGNGGLVAGAIVRLPYYVGIRKMLLSLPALVAAIDAAVAGSDLVCVKLPGVIGTIAASRAVRRQIPFTAEVVGDIGEVLRAGVGGRLGRLLSPIATHQTRNTVRKASAVRYVTKFAMQERYPAGPNAKQVVHTDVVIDDQEIERDTEGVRPGLIVSVGSQEQDYKGHDVLLRALSELVPSQPLLHLELIGSGRYQPTLRALVQQLGLTGRVTFSGYVTDRDELMSRLDRAEIFALPSRTEGLPRALIEAMSRGLPCVASSVGGVSELLDAEATCPPGDVPELVLRLKRLLTDQDFRIAQSARNRTVASEYSRTKMKSSRMEWRRAVLNIVHRSRTPT